MKGVSCPSVRKNLSFVIDAVIVALMVWCLLALGGALLSWLLRIP